MEGRMEKRKILGIAYLRYRIGLDAILEQDYRTRFSEKD